MTDDNGCTGFVELVTAFLEGVLDERTERRLLEHLVACEGCERYLEQMSRTVQVIGQLPPENLSTDSEQRLLTVFRSWRGDFPS